jgi:Holliday junction resolvase-like predicted endonuclease
MKLNREEKIVRRMLISQGFLLDEQRDEKHNGIDIVAMKNGKVLLIEVKKAKRHNRAWQVDSISKKQQTTCNTIAIVFPKELVTLEPMSQHLKLCAKNGLRYITENANLVSLVMG